MHKKSQSALEFLTTYAWAFLVMLIIISAIAYFGVLRPQQIVPDRCTFNVAFECQAYRISPTTFNLRLKNNVGDTITVQVLGLSTESATPFACTGNPSPPSSWSPGDVKDFTWTGCNGVAVGFSRGEKGKININMTYYEVRAGATYSQLAQGEAFAAVN